MLCGAHIGLFLASIRAVKFMTRKCPKYSQKGEEIELHTSWDPVKPGTRNNGIRNNGIIIAHAQ